MSLSTDLVSQFVKATNDTQTKKKETSMKGKVVKITDNSGTASYYVKIDGSDALTPINTLTDMDDGDRVVVEIENHTATVTGNITSPSARTADLKDAEDKIVANTADIGTIKADYVKTGVIEAANGRITNLEAKNADIEKLVAQKATIDDLKAANAEIEDLKANKADIDSLDSKYVDIDFTNIEKANIKEFFSKSGMIKDLTISNGYITGKLVAIEIDGDLIQTGTLVADKLVIKTEDGLLYKLNAEALGSAGLAQIEDPETLKEGLHGALILDKTIVAEKIKVKDLEAFGATIGGFKIDSDAIHSVVKESVDNTTRGIYMDNDGQLNVGDTFNFVKFYRDGNYKPLTVEPSTWSTTYRSYFYKVNDEYVQLSSDTAPTFETGKYYEAVYKLAISADNVHFGSSRKDLQEALNEVADGSISGVDVEYLESYYASDPLAIRTFSGVENVTVSGHKGTHMRGYLDSDNKLLIPYFNNATLSKNGLHVKANEDGSISIWGTTTSYQLVWLRPYGSGWPVELEDGVYTLSMESNKSIGNSVCFNGRYQNHDKLNATPVYPAHPVQGTVSGSDKQLSFYIEIFTSFPEATETDPVIVYPMINKGSTAIPYMIPKTRKAADTEITIPETTVIFSGGTSSSVQGSISFSNKERKFDVANLDQLIFSLESKYKIVIKAGDTANNSDWSTAAPTWKDDIYIWSRTKTVSANGTFAYSNPACITGNTGIDGKQGIGVSSIVEQYYLSTSEVEPTDGDWGNAQPAWSSGRYIWTRSFITWSDNTTSTTAPILAHAINDANSNADHASSDADKANDAAEDAKEVADQVYSEISKLNDSIKNLVVGKDGSTLMTQTPNGWQFNFGNFKETIDDIGKKTAYVHIDETDAGNPKIELGKADNESKLTLTNEDIQFVVGSEVPTKVTSEGLDTDKIKVDNEFAMGRFTWKNRKNGNLGLSWKGAKS